ncbi:MAG: AAA family ATPase [Sphingomonadales bacterium]|nr:AAA family ATPase [Sphingomonadales bacterium]PIX66869.1 MAG: ATPase [Sphingomonadales bacterium CG_4_10_14_3_um_filter_58_15]NCO48229.1 AAA family ATPase [Sphingomonadales bacterium]NCO99742.1 AAA family ATPase [Sphingomonadales bacterium]NCP27425.1 AAA family ATPase [Sphingomonadales bacterium]
MTDNTHHIVFANEKGGTGKSTTAVHVAVALAYQGHKVALIDLDPRQRTSYRYLENRDATMKRLNIEIPQPDYDVFEDDNLARLEQLIERLADGADFLLYDTPGRDDKFARFVATRANTLVTPINDSFVDFDLIGQVDPETYKVKKLSFYAELIWDARKARAKADGATIDWVLLRNRTQYVEAHNMKRIVAALAELSQRVGFRIIPGLSERVIYRELFPSGMTMLDKKHLGRLATSHLAARQELRELIKHLALPQTSRDTPDGVDTGLAKPKLVA